MTSRRLVAVALLGACGRIGYDPVGTTDAADDGAAACALRSVSLGRDHGCAANAVGDVYCWGDNSYGRVAVTGAGWRTTPTRVPLPAPAVDVTVNSGASCARLADRSLVCWGADKGGAGAALDAVTPVPLSGPVEQLVGGLGYFCARLADGAVECWGDNVKGQLGTPPQPFPRDPARVPGVAGAVDLAAGHRSMCARTATGATWCWGDNRLGQLGLGTTSESEAPTVSAALASFDALALGGRHACGRTFGDVRCWGTNDRLQVAASGGAVSMPGPVRASDVAEVVAMARSTCARTDAGAVACWGENRAGELGNGALARVAAPFAIPGLVATRIYAGAHVGCAELGGGALTCWGDDTSGVLGRGTQALSTAPIRVAPALPSAVVEVAVTGDTVCAALADGDVWCWGDNQLGALGNSSFDGTTQPIRTYAAPAGGALRDLAASAGLFCGRDGTGVICWGVGTPGDGSAGLIATPRRGVTGSFGAIAIGLDHVCAARGAEVACWGENRFGQLGTGDLADSFTPVVALGVTNPRAVASFSNHTCAIDGGQRLWCWGLNSVGQLGDPGRPSMDPTPRQVQLPSGRPVIAVATGNAHTCAADDNGALYCWGQGDSGQLGVIAAMAPTPTLVPSIAGARAIYAHSDTTCVTTDADKTVCFGANGSGALGNGGRGGGATPGPFGTVDATSAIVDLGASHDLRCAVRADGELWCAGRGSRGALGPGLVGWTPAAIDLPCQ